MTPTTAKSIAMRLIQRRTRASLGLPPGLRSMIYVYDNCIEVNLRDFGQEEIRLITQTLRKLVNAPPGVRYVIYT